MVSSKDVYDLEFRSQPLKSHDFILTFLLSFTPQILEDQVCITFTTGYNEGRAKVCLISIFQIRQSDRIISLIDPDKYPYEIFSKNSTGKAKFPTP